jgi:small subunit ribosomal protein SAe
MSQVPPVLNLREEDVKRMLACQVHLGSQNMDITMTRYVHKRNENGVHIIDLRKTWEKLVLAARTIVAIENPKDVCAVGLSSLSTNPYAQRAVLKLGQYIGCKTIAGRFTPGTFTNQQQPQFFEPRLLIASDTRKDHQPIVEASYVNMPVIAFCNADSSLRGIDIAIPCNTSGKNSIALMYWLLAREVLRLRSAIPRDKEWSVMVDLFVFRDPEETEKQQRSIEDAGQSDAGGATGGEGQTTDWQGEIAPSTGAEGDDCAASEPNWGTEAATDGGW